MANTSWSGNRRSFPTATRQLILRRDPRCRCNGCPDHDPPCPNPSTVADHVTPHAEGGSDHPSNGQGLCEGCHDHKTEAERARGRARTSRKRPPEPHPGYKPPGGTTGPQGGTPLDPDRAARTA